MNNEENCERIKQLEKDIAAVNRKIDAMLAILLQPIQGPQPIITRIDGSDLILVQNRQSRHNPPPSTPSA
jgi:hypothetical protein